MANSKQVAPPGEKPARRCVIPPALGEEYFPFLSFVKRPVRTRMRGVVGAGEGDLPGYPIRLPRDHGRVRSHSRQAEKAVAKTQAPEKLVSVPGFAARR